MITAVRLGRLIVAILALVLAVALARPAEAATSRLAAANASSYAYDQPQQRANRSATAGSHASSDAGGRQHVRLTLRREPSRAAAAGFAAETGGQLNERGAPR